MSDLGTKAGESQRVTDNNDTRGSSVDSESLNKLWKDLGWDRTEPSSATPAGSVSRSPWSDAPDSGQKQPQTGDAPSPGQPPASSGDTPIHSANPAHHKPSPWDTQADQGSSLSDQPPPLVIPPIPDLNPKPADQPPVPGQASKPDSIPLLPPPEQHTGNDSTLPPIFRPDSNENQNQSPVFLPPKPGQELPPIHQPTKPADPSWDPDAPLPPFIINDDSKIPQGGPRVDDGKIYELNHLNNRAADHSTPDAIVRIPANFDPTKPIHLAIFNHGWTVSVRGAYNASHLGEQMANAPPNTVLIVPEWQRTAGASNSNQGNFSTPGKFRSMLQEIFNKTPELQGKTLNDVDGISILSHSAGYVPTSTELYNNGLEDKVKSITMLDSLYNSSEFDSWLQDNSTDIAAGRKRFYSFFFNDTGSENRSLANRINRLVPGANVLTDYNNGGNLLSAQEIAQHSIVFKYSNMRVDGQSEHWTIPRVYVDPVERAANAIPH